MSADFVVAGGVGVGADLVVAGRGGDCECRFSGGIMYTAVSLQQYNFRVAKLNMNSLQPEVQYFTGLHGAAVRLTNLVPGPDPMIRPCDY